MLISSSGFDSSFREISSKLKMISTSEDPIFARYNSASDYIKKTLKPFQKYKNIIVIGHGGSITSTQGFWGMLRNDKKNLFIIDTPEPDYMEEIKNKCKKKDSVVIVVSKSGTNVDVIEIMFYFSGYTTIGVTNSESGALLEIVKKTNITFIEHPAIGGRFSAFTSSTLVPCHLLGIDIDKLIQGANAMYKRCSPQNTISNNPALKTAVELFTQDKKGYDEVYMPIYSKRLDGFENLIIQLIHESSGKNGKGQTFFSASAPEAQHHTNQRFFGGRRNVIGLFIKAEPSIQKNDQKIVIPHKLAGIPMRNGTLGDLGGNTYSQILEFEFEGVVAHAKRNKIPHIVLSIERGDECELGEFVAYWQYVAVYSSLLREVNPFDQPEVEFAKNVSFEKRISAAKKD